MSILYREDECDITFLFEDKKWNGSSISNMKNSHVINTMLMLRRRAEEFKRNYEMFVIDNMNNKLLVPKDNINNLMKKDALSWMVETPIYIALLEELDERNLAEYYSSIVDKDVEL